MRLAWAGRAGAVKERGNEGANGGSPYKRAKSASMDKERKRDMPEEVESKRKETESIGSIYREHERGRSAREGRA